MTDSSWPRRERPAFPDDAATARLPNLRSVAVAEPFLAVAGIGAWIYMKGGHHWWSEEMRRIYGVGPDYQPSLEDGMAFVPAEYRQPIIDAMQEALDAGRSWDLEMAIVRADGQRRRVRVRGRAVDPAPGAPPTVFGTIEDITARHQAAERAARELQLRSQTETLLRDVIDSIPAGLTVYDSDERLILTNSVHQDLLPGSMKYAVKGTRLVDLITNKLMAGDYAPDIGPDDPPAVRAAWVADYLRRFRSPGYVRVFRLPGDHYLQASTATSASGNILSIRTDVTALKRAERELRRQAEEDALTGLVNRSVLLQRLEDLPATSGAGVLVLLDIDFFKAVNDSLGHGAGDLLLRLTGRRLKRLIGPGDTAARLAGDEFALILHGPHNAAAIAALAGRLLARLRRPMRLGANRYAPSVSMGLAPFPAPCCGPRELLSNADAALLDAKRQGRGRHVLFDAALAEQVLRRGRLADALRKALAGGALQAALQPQQRLSDGGVLGFEALARWQHDGEWISPAEFVPLAEAVGLAQPLGTQVMDKAVAGFAAMLAAGLEPGHLAINVSTAQLLADDFLETVQRCLARHGVPAGRLEIEVTESVLLDRSIARIGQTLDALRAMGCTLAMDDFGTGYASLSHLTGFPVDRIKIDKNFTRAIDGDGDRGLIARTLIGLGRALALDVIAEGVETPSQRSFLRAHGCTAIQGFLFARPMLADQAAQWLAAQQQPSTPLANLPSRTRA